MSMYVIGSRAANHWHPDIWTDPKDLDLMAKPDDFRRWLDLQTEMGLVTSCTMIGKGRYVAESVCGMMIEIEVATPGSSAEYFIDNVDGETGGYYFYPSMDWLFALKASHRYLKDSPHFEKTITDYHNMKTLGYTIPDQVFFKMREDETYNKPRPNLNRSKADFFVKDEGVNYIYDHDSIHKAMSQMDKPAYMHYQDPDSEVMCSKKLWDECHEMIKLCGVLEETYVLALERSQVPHRGKLQPRQSFMIALSKVCTSITSGWFREYAYENYFTILSMYSDDYVKIFDQAVADGIVVPVDTGKAIAT